ncbi:hypothetical protein ACHAXT_009396 [Thalassiosira profunda]
MNPAAALLALLSLSAAAAFVQVGPPPPRKALSPLHATEAFQRSLLAARLGSNAKENGATAVADAPSAAAGENMKDDDERFHRSLLEAKLAYDKINAALAATPAAPVVAVPAPPAVAPVVAAPAPAAAAVDASVPKPVIAEPTPAPKQAVKNTEFTVPRELAIVPINESTVQFTAGAIGGAAGLALGGLPLALAGAAACNYLSRKDDNVGDGTSAKKVVDAGARTALLAYNFLAQFEKDNKVVDSILNILEKVVDKAKEADTPAGEAIVTLESVLGGVANKVEELNDDYDLVGGAGTVLDSVGDLVEMGADKVVEMNEEYKLTERASTVVKGAVDKVADRRG